MEVAEAVSANRAAAEVGWLSWTDFWPIRGSLADTLGTRARVRLDSVRANPFPRKAELFPGKRMRSGDRPGLQNRRTAGNPVIDGFDSHSLPPFVFNNLLVSECCLRSEKQA